MFSRRTLQSAGPLLEYEIRGLFGMYDHAFELDVDEPTILTGANGTGKSTILRSLAALGDGDWAALARLPYRSLRLRFERAPEIRVNRRDDELAVTSEANSWRYLLRKGEAFPREALVGDYLLAEPAADEASQGALDRQTAEVLMRSARRRAREAIRLTEREVRVDDWLLEFVSRFRVAFISDQRLTLRLGAQQVEGETARHAASVYATDLRRQISRELARYATSSQRVDREFPQRVAEAMGTEVGPNELRSLLQQVGEKREALQRVGLLGESETDQPFDESALDRAEVRPVIATYAQVTLEKLKILEPFRRRLELFVNFLDDRFADKRAVTTDEDGLHFELDRTRDIVSTAGLSSGEQQMLVLAYRLLFQTDPGTLLLIDEPEISLHVSWQTSFIDDIAEMGRDQNVQFLLASHSPVLIGGREELKRSLDPVH